MSVNGDTVGAVNAGVIWAVQPMAAGLCWPLVWLHDVRASAPRCDQPPETSTFTRAPTAS